MALRGYVLLVFLLAHGGPLDLLHELPTLVGVVSRRGHCLCVFHPVRKSKVHSLSKVEALIEASMVGSRERDHKLTSTLVSADNLRRS